MIAALRASLAEYGADRISTGEFVRRWRAQTELRARLPERYGVVLDDLLMRLESSALFSGESCSFSRSELLGGFELWLDKAEQALSRTG